MIGGVGDGIGYFREGFRLIRQPGLRGLVVIPILINVILFGLFIYFLGSYVSGWVDWAVAQLPDWLYFLAWLLWLLFAALVLVVLIYGFVFVANLIGAPFYGLLAERVEEHLTGKTSSPPLTWRSALMLVPKSLLREVQKLLYYLPRILVILLLGFVPLVQVGAPVLSVLFSAWMMAIQFVDYPADNQGVRFPDLRRTLGRRRLTCASFGGCVLLGSLIPILNLFVMPAAVAGGTALWVRELQPGLAAGTKK